MSLFLETISVVYGQLRNMDYHNARFNATRKDHFGISKEENLADIIRVPTDKKKANRLKCRVEYGKIINSISFDDYQPRKIQELKVVVADDIEYRYKYKDRSMIDSLLENAEGADDIIIVKEGLVTDASYANLCFRERNHWFTPDSPLLKGTKRQYYLDRGLISERKIKATDISKYQWLCFINALLDIGELRIPTDKIF